MALTAPTAPTPPTAPVVPGARQGGSQDSGAGQEAGNGAAAAAEMGRGFGVHITINPPGQADAGKGGSPEGTVVQTVPTGQQVSGAEQGKAIEKPSPDKESSDAAAAEVAQQARQAAVQRMLGEDDGSQQQAEAVVRADSPWPLSGSNFSFMTFLPLILVFVAAFITFTLRNLAKEDELKKPKSGTKQGSSHPELADKGKNGTIRGTVQPVAAQKEDKSKGRHFEMRI